jgi:hypothetical protein
VGEHGLAGTRRTDEQQAVDDRTLAHPLRPLKPVTLKLVKLKLVKVR